MWSGKWNDRVSDNRVKFIMASVSTKESGKVRNINTGVINFITPFSSFIIASLLGLRK